MRAIRLGTGAAACWRIEEEQRIALERNGTLGCYPAGPYWSHAGRDEDPKGCAMFKIKRGGGKAAEHD